MTARAERLHASPWQGVFYLTGGGSPLLADLLTIPGASKTVKEASVPYAEQALRQLLGSAPEQAASMLTGRILAMRAFQRALALDADRAFGFGLTASLSSATTKRGQTRAYWAIQTISQSSSYTLILNNADSRTEQEQQLNQALWQSIEHSLLGEEWVECATKKSSFTAPEHWQPLLAQSTWATCTQDHNGELILPGSFNPVHQGHRQMLALAESITGRTGAFELTLRNADKPDLDYLTVQERLIDLEGTPVWLTNLSNFEQKARRFPGAVFALGADTLARVAQPRFYADDQRRMLQAIDNMVQQNITFLVFGRVEHGRFVELSDLDLPSSLTSICRAVPAEVYRNDISSSAIRAAQSQVVSDSYT